jgi:hypothetical protein
MLAASSHGGVNAAAAQSPTKWLYKDSNQPIALRVKDLLSRMTLAEKIGQMTQIERSVANASDIEHYFIGDYHPEHILHSLQSLYWVVEIFRPHL